jgi:hemolysin III
MYRGEYFNSITHLIGTILALIGAIVLVTRAGEAGEVTRIISFTVYGVTLFLLYLASTLYHSLRGRAKQVLRIIDHHAIYLLIAGTYTPFTLIALKGETGWWLFGTVWALASCGMILDTWRGGGGSGLSVIIYLLMGWLIVVALGDLLAALPAAGFLWLLAGGIAYTLGVICYALDTRWPGCHGIWHLFVLAGSVSHYCAILLYL